MKKLNNFLIIGAFIMFSWAFVLIANVFDFDYISPHERYDLEKCAFERQNENWYREFPDYEAWQAFETARHDAFKQEFGIQCAESFDIFDSNAEKFSKLRTDQSYRAEPPAEWNRAERD